MESGVLKLKAALRCITTGIKVDPVTEIQFIVQFAQRLSAASNQTSVTVSNKLLNT